ncbi:hypothetical protein TcWFU_005818 [Taenia crassiceps]|uniref:Uncharacterized protein n=1 Tax=Taenia crassiceps TaxID=6207 RepID=A0ABR4Q9H0_9CEST
MHLTGCHSSSHPSEQNGQWEVLFCGDFYVTLLIAPLELNPGCYLSSDSVSFMPSQGSIFSVESGRTVLTKREGHFSRELPRTWRSPIVCLILESFFLDGTSLFQRVADINGPEIK